LSTRPAISGSPEHIALFSLSQQLLGIIRQQPTGGDLLSHNFLNARDKSLVIFITFL